MARKDPGRKIEFDSPATITELISALEDLRSHLGNNAKVRVGGFVTGLTMEGSLVKHVTADAVND